MYRDFIQNSITLQLKKQLQTKQKHGNNKSGCGQRKYYDTVGEYSIRGEVGGARGVEWVWLASVVVKAQTDREGGNGPKENVDLGNR